MQQKIDNLLLLKIANGDQAAFKILFDSYIGKLTGYLHTIVKSSVIAEEIAMDVLTKIWLARDLLKEVKDADAFFFKIAKNKAIDYFRSIANKPTLYEDVWSHSQSIQEIDKTDNLILEKEFEKQLLTAIDLLSPQRKKIFLLSRYEDLSQDEIAVKMGLSKATVNNHISDAKKFVRQYLIEHVDILAIVLFIEKLK